MICMVHIFKPQKRISHFHLIYLSSFRYFEIKFCCSKSNLYQSLSIEQDSSYTIQNCYFLPTVYK